jgi:hypothetical protein
MIANGEFRTFWNGDLDLLTTHLPLTFVVRHRTSTDRRQLFWSETATSKVPDGSSDVRVFFDRFTLAAMASLASEPTLHRCRMGNS